MSGELIPSAAVVLLRRADPFEVLVVRRSAEMRFYGGAWVFPGGRVDPDEQRADPIESARVAAVREVHEETRLLVNADALRPLSRWTTPVERPRRYRAWFFLGEHPGGEVEVDGSEIHAHWWTRPAEALAARERGDLILPPPVFVTLSVLAEQPSLESAIALAEGPPQHYDPRVSPIAGGHASLYEGDAGFLNGNGEMPGRRHRLWMTEREWRYERSG
ncbi:MAG: NUDIX hydrolase [Deltaproteobacteria bacterium]|nr:NUDIX hydrolase [Deltaproteobacteria bacterium]